VRPTCQRCLQGCRPCTWPTHDQMTDRRYLSRSKSSEISSIISPYATPAIIQAANQEILEPILMHHFRDKLLPLLSSPESSSELYDRFFCRIQQNAPTYKKLRYTVLANTASHLYLTDRSSQMQDLALGYYSQSLREMSREVAKPTCTVDDTEGTILISIIMLYLHGVCTFAINTQSKEVANRCGLASILVSAPLRIL
jgi:hypothetical protein